jgi:hypothetical protein
MFYLLYVYLNVLTLFLQYKTCNTHHSYYTFPFICYVMKNRTQHPIKIQERCICLTKTEQKIYRYSFTHGIRLYSVPIIASKGFDEK